METEEYIIFIIVGIIFLNAMIVPSFIQAKENIGIFISKVYLIFSNNTVKIIIIILALEILIYFIYKLIRKIISKAKKVAEDKRLREKELKESLDINLELCDYEELAYLSEKYKSLHIEFPKHKEDFETISRRIKIKMKELEGLKKLEKINYEKIRSKEELEKINYEIYIKKLKEEDKRRNTIQKLGIGEKSVLKRNRLSKQETKIATEEGYKSVNEYCVLENKIIPVLVDSPLNHSPTHTFLVWSTKRLLKTFPKITNIAEHDTREADLTFKINKKAYAIEVEKGSLLRKKNQLRGKIEDLKDKYDNKWLILVSNKNLIKKYKEFGDVSTRKNLKNKIEKWIKNSLYLLLKYL